MQNINVNFKETKKDDQSWPLLSLSTPYCVDLEGRRASLFPQPLFQLTLIDQFCWDYWLKALLF